MNVQAVIIPFVVTLFFFYIEACIHYNMGKYGTIGCKIPPLKENIKMIGIISVFTLFSVTATYLLERYFSKV